MRSHGVPNFPDPPPGFGAGPAHIAIDTSSPQVRSGLNACRPLLPPGVSIGQQHPPAQLLAQELKFSRCMRAHGITSFPDPRQDGVLAMTGSGFDPNSPEYQRAYHACRSDLPNGIVKSPPQKSAP
jgi:hypothetical protein